MLTGGTTALALHVDGRSDGIARMLEERWREGAAALRFDGRSSGSRHGGSGDLGDESKADAAQHHQ